MIDLMSALGFQGSNEIFYTFYSYIHNGVNQFDLCDLQSKHEDVTFEVYFSSFQNLLADSSYITPTDEPFKTCLRGHVLSVYNSDISTIYRRLEQRFNLFFRWLTALRTGEQVLSEIRDYSLTGDCINALFKMDSCAQCSGEVLNVATCPGFCSNTLRSCLVDLYEFIEVFDEYTRVLGNVQDDIELYDPFQALNFLQNQVSNMVADFYSLNAVALTNTVRYST